MFSLVGFAFDMICFTPLFCGQCRFLHVQHGVSTRKDLTDVLDCWSNYGRSVPLTTWYNSSNQVMTPRLDICLPFLSLSFARRLAAFAHASGLPILPNVAPRDESWGYCNFQKPDDLPDRPLPTTGGESRTGTRPLGIPRR